MSVCSEGKETSNHGPVSADERFIAFYLPQFHPIDINEGAHGRGFTEWTDVARAKPFFRNHEQPVYPEDLGYYDLRLPEVRQQQADLASTYGVDAFCYWHYWTGGNRIMERPLSEVVESGVPANTFCIGWANHSLIDVRNSGELLFEQVYPGPEDDKAHFSAIESALHYPLYLLVDGKPLIYLFRPLDIPNLHAFVDRWRDIAQRSGLTGLWFVGQERSDDDPHLKKHVFEALDGSVDIRLHGPERRLRWRIVDRVRHGPYRYRYSDFINIDHEPPFGSILRYPSVVTNWDNTPRIARRGSVLVDPDPKHFETLVRQARERIAGCPAQQKIIFVKSWNEWGEGNYLEPDLRWGRGRLEALRRGRGLTGLPSDLSELALKGPGVVTKAPRLE